MKGWTHRMFAKLSFFLFSKPKIFGVPSSYIQPLVFNFYYYKTYNESCYGMLCNDQSLYNGNKLEKKNTKMENIHIRIRTPVKTPSKPVFYLHVDKKTTHQQNDKL